MSLSNGILSLSGSQCSLFESFLKLWSLLTVVRDIECMFKGICLVV